MINIQAGYILPPRLLRRFFLMSGLIRVFAHILRYLYLYDFTVLLLVSFIMPL